ncbi:Phosphoenolpyruvate-dihydroxyacetone phosphotransferase, subunit DhaM / DHA-specific IIA component [Streptococcus sp. DD11]|uniref:dihydroxyacetone kinase phosphoryl donor subunit DhaM n=1 Tax=Streptococcus sp. DD11 TaxID=1777879 RepID=UPI00079932EC|nr:dihydroxyacetone kinase phosphoryl donor subunit DhaM [Streptococcus sp. DD11]KXT77512.1 Phosphoenolpyruvate-dihydroxyacetone phosphotransferase, subunit DhaM / DHA-specific IIA component [Streptococcus sp. DD11]
MADTGILIVSHSQNLAQGVFDLISQVAADVAVSYVGGLEDGSIGTSFDGITAALAANDKERILAFYDLGSARMNLEMAADFSDKEILIQTVPLVEGAYTAAALLQAGADLPAVLLQVRELEIKK